MQQNHGKERVRFSVINAMYFAIVAVTTYQTVYLQEIGLSSSQIGSTVALASFFGLLIIPVWGVVGDMLHSAKVPFLLCVLVISVLYFAMPILGKRVNGNAVFFSAFISLIYLFKQPTNSMLDSWSISELTPLKIGYGQVRMWGGDWICSCFGNTWDGGGEGDKRFVFVLPDASVGHYFILYRTEEAVRPSEGH